MVDSTQALARLIAGNQRFAAGQVEHASLASDARRRELLEGQSPFAIILGCSDSRVPAEIVFDQGLGDLFVIRVAGNVVAPSQIASVEFAVEFFGSRLVVVLGHTSCGAVAATLQRLQGDFEARSHNLDAIVERIIPAVEPLLDVRTSTDDPAIMRRAVRANIRASAERLRRGSPFLEDLVDRGELQVVGAEYSLESGEVEFFDRLA